VIISRHPIQGVFWKCYDPNRGFVREYPEPLTAAGEVAPPRRPATTAIPAVRQPWRARLGSCHCRRSSAPPLFLLRPRTTTAPASESGNLNRHEIFLRRDPAPSHPSPSFLRSTSRTCSRHLPWTTPSQPSRANPINNAMMDQEDVVRWNRQL
jgi:hypothetical protein